MKIIKIDIKNPDPKGIIAAAKIIKAGGVVVYPSDTSYGLAADFFNKNAIDKIYSIKNRPQDKKLSVNMKNIEMIEKYCQINNKARNILERYLPGPITIILPMKQGYTREQSTLAVRIPNNNVTKALSDALDFPYTATSANISGEVPIYTSSLIINTYNNKVNKPDLFLDAGGLPVNSPSTIIDLTSNSPKILRQGEVNIDF